MRAYATILHQQQVFDFNLTEANALCQALAQRDYRNLDRMIQRTVTRERIGLDMVLQQIDYLEKQSKPFVIIDATLLRANPERVLTDLCRELGLGYDERMLRLDSEDLEYGQAGQEFPTFFRRIRSSGKIDFPDEPCPNLGSFAPDIQRLLFNRGLPAYEDLLNHPNLIGLGDRDAIQELLDMPYDGMTLRRIDPVFSDMIEEAASHSNREREV